MEMKEILAELMGNIIILKYFIIITSFYCSRLLGGCIISVHDSSLLYFVFTQRCSYEYYRFICFLIAIMMST